MPPIFDRKEQLSRDLAAAASGAAPDRRALLIDRAEEAVEELALWAALERKGVTLPDLAGLVFSVKACFDVAGWITGSASRATEADEAAAADAPLVDTLRKAGAVLIGQTNMTEFAYGALGVNSRFGTPCTPLDPSGERVSGGSTSGGAVCVATGLADLSLGSDTSGSARIPAAFCGCLGFKPSRGRYDRRGMAFLSPSFDEPGLLVCSMGVLLRADRVLSREAAAPPVAGALRYAVPAMLFENPIDRPVQSAFEAFLAALKAQGVRVETVDLPTLTECARIASEGRIIAAEAYHVHRDRIERSFDLYDPLVGGRILRCREVPAHDYIAAKAGLARHREQFEVEIAGFDGFLLPTTPMEAPRLADLADPEHYLATNARALSLTEFANRLGLPSISMPLGPLMTGVMLTGLRGRDADLLAQAEILAGVAARIDIGPERH